VTKEVFGKTSTNPTGDFLNICYKLRSYTLLLNPEVHLNSPSPSLMLSQINPVSNFTYFYKTHFILSSDLSLGSQHLFVAGFPTKMLYTFIVNPCVLHVRPISSSLI